METAILGTWKLVSASSCTDSGDRNDAPFGREPAGFLTYTQDGRMSAMISFGGRKPLSSSDSDAAPIDEQAEAFKTFLAYAGRFTLNSEKIIHHVEISSIQAWVGTDLTRTIKLQGERIVLAAPPVLSGGKVRGFELVWQRVARSSQ